MYVRDIVSEDGTLEGEQRHLKYFQAYNNSGYSNVSQKYEPKIQSEKSIATVLWTYETRFLLIIEEVIRNCKYKVLREAREEMKMSC